MIDDFRFLLLLIFGLGVMFWLISRKLTLLADSLREDKVLLEWLKEMRKTLEGSNRSVQEALNRVNTNVTSTLQKDSANISMRLDKAAQVIGRLQREMGQFSEIGRGIKDLQNFLRSPKLRGNLGEQVLKDLLRQHLPKQSFFLQHSFRSGAVVDVAIKTERGMIAVDSKFPMENFRKMMTAVSDRDKQQARRFFVTDVRKHIRDIAHKYILPDEGTLDYALMYIPSEPVYYEIVANMPELTDYSYKMRVLLVSPNTFYAYLRAILLSLEGQRLEKQAQKVVMSLRTIRKDAERFEERLGVLNRHITNAFNGMSSVLSSFSILGQKISSAADLGWEEKKELKEPGKHRDNSIN